MGIPNGGRGGSPEQPLSRGEAPLRVLLVGPDATLLRESLSLFADCQTVDNFVEAILLVGEAAEMGTVGGAGEGSGSTFDLIAAGISQESDQLQRALEGFRAVHPSGRLVLLCEACHEPHCRRAITWGASDYVILPLGDDAIGTLQGRRPNAARTLALAESRPSEPDARQIPAPPSLNARRDLVEPAHPSDFQFEPRLEIKPEPKPAEPRTPEPKRLEPRAVEARIEPRLNRDKALQIDLLKLPLVVQAGMIDAVMQGGDFAARALATLQAHHKWPGTLRFTADPAQAKLDAQKYPDRVAVPVVHDHIDFGVLALEGGRTSAAVAAQLDQAAAWLAAWLALSRQQEQLRRLAITDELSGAYNRRYFNEWVSQLLEKAAGQRFRVTLLWFDIDNFKRYNDHFGHPAGDAIIREVIKLLRHCTRADDMVFRVGGDEFAAVFWDHEAPRQPNSQHPRDAVAVAERFQRAIANHEWSRCANIQGTVGISGGLATYPWDSTTLDGLIEVADGALLRAKAGGKNIILLSDEATGRAEAEARNPTRRDDCDGPPDVAPAAAKPPENTRPPDPDAGVEREEGQALLGD